METLWPALHEVQTGWSDGLSDVKFYMFMLLEPRYCLHFLQSAIPGVCALVGVRGLVSG